MGAPITTNLDYLRRLVADNKPLIVTEDTVLTNASQVVIVTVPAGAQDVVQITFPPAGAFINEELLILAQDLTGQAAGAVHITVPTDCLTNILEEVVMVAGDWVWLKNIYGLAIMAVPVIAEPN